eukprot:3300908-Pyramimonas_sp.AAC.1
MRGWSRFRRKGARTPDDHVVEDPPPPEKTEVDQTAPDGHAHGTGSAEPAQQPMVGHSQADESKTAEKRNKCVLADKGGVHGYWNAFDYCYERFKKEGNPDPRLDLTVMSPNGPR